MKTKEAYQEALRAYLVLKNFSASTVSAYGGAFRQFLDWRVSRKYGEDFTPEQARQYLLYRYEQGLKWQTINGDSGDPEILPCFSICLVDKRGAELPKKA